MRRRVIIVLHLIAIRYRGTCPATVVRCYGGSQAIIDDARMSLAVSYLARSRKQAA